MRRWKPVSLATERKHTGRVGALVSAASLRRCSVTFANIKTSASTTGVIDLLHHVGPFGIKTASGRKSGDTA